MDRVRRSVDAQDAISLVIGPPGTGKSLICALLVDHYRSTHDVVVLGETPIDGREAFQRHLLHHLGADFDRIAERDLQLELMDRVCSDQAAEGGLLIVVDEAQSLPAEVLEAIRMATNIMRDGERRVIAVLCGGVKLDETLADQSMEAFTQRVATRCYLHPLNAEETGRYITETIRACGSDPEATVTDEAIAAVHHACCGVPRLINQMLTQAIDCAEEAEQDQITEQIIDQAWAQLQQLPSPMVEEPRIAHKVPPVEFGELDDSVSFADWDPGQNASQDGTDKPDLPQVDLPECEVGESSECENTAHPMEEAGVEIKIQVEPATANWVDEPAEHPTPSTASAATLFGDFEQEEEISVGSGFTRPQPSVPPTNLEEILQQEVFNVSAIDETTSLASDVSVIWDDGQYPEAEALPTEVEESPPDVVKLVEEDVECQMADAECQVGEAECQISDAECQVGDAEDAVLRMPQADHLEMEEDISIRDDSDILVIEDEIELRRQEPAARIRGQEQTISVDFQAMLSRMQGSR